MLQCVSSLLGWAALVLASALVFGACGGSTDVALTIVQVQGVVTATVDDRPIEGVGVALTYPIGNDRGRSETSWTDSLGHYAVSLTDLICTPGSLDLGVVLPPGYRFPDDLVPAAIRCTEDVQTLDFQLEPAP